MTDFLAPFELRRLVVKFSRTVGGGVTEDAVAFTIHLAKITAGAIDAGWTAANYAACEARLDTWWTSQKVMHPTQLALVAYLWYKDGPVYSPSDRADGPSNPADRSTVRNVAATGATAGGSSDAPQVAMTVTKVTSTLKRNGRLYLPAPGSALSGSGDGRIPSAQVASMLGFMVTLFNGFRADGFKPVVFSRGRSAHAAKSGATIPDHTATAYEILSLRMDNLFDVVRSRRYAHPTVRTTTALT